MRKLIQSVMAALAVVVSGVKMTARTVIAAGMVAIDLIREYAPAAVGLGIVGSTLAVLVLGNAMQVAAAAMHGAGDGLSLALVMSFGRLKEFAPETRRVLTMAVHDLNHGMAGATLVAVMKAVGEMVIG